MHNQMANEQNTSITWKEYSVVGLVVAMMLEILNFSGRVYYLVIPVILFFLVTGIKM